MDRPSFWPDELSWVDFKHPSYTRIKDVNLVLENFCVEFDIDINKHHEEEDADFEEPPKKKKSTSTKHVSAGVDDTVEEEEDVNSSLFDVEFEDNQDNLKEDNEILAESNSVISSQSELLEPCEYENIRNNNIAELNAKLAEAQEAGLF